MPLIQLTTTTALADVKRKELLDALSVLVAESTGKPEQYVMATISTAAMSMSGKTGDAAFADVRSIGGLNRQVNQEISSRLCALLKESLGIAPDRVYVNFTDVAASHWGWNSETFG